MKRIIFLLLVSYSLSVQAQNVGIGISNPAAKLQINSTSSGARPLVLLYDSSSGINNHLQFAKQGSANSWLLSAFPQATPGSSSLKFGFSSGTTPLTLLGDGRVGINKTSPSLALDVSSTNSNVASFNGGSSMWVTLSELDVDRGYIGSYSGEDADVDFGTYGSNINGKVHLTTGNQPRLSVIPNGNVGVNTTVPTEKLEVNGNLNITQTIKANGTAGQPGQLLSTGSNGNLKWINPSEFSNHYTITTIGNANWTVPAGVTRVMIEGWGGGGGGSNLGGGGGGAYVAVFFGVTPGQNITLYTGDGGTGGGSTSGTNGVNTEITTPSGIITAPGGRGATTNVSFNGSIGRGGQLTSFTDAGYIYLPGQDGSPSSVNYMQSGTSTFLEELKGGKGGDAGNALNSGAYGGYRLFNTSSSTVVRYVSTHMAARPGGGGGSDFQGGSYGGAGLIVIHY